MPDPATDLITGAFSVQTTAWWRCCRHGALDRLFGRLSPHSSFISDQLTAKTGTGASQQRNQPKSPLGGADFGDLRAKKEKDESGAISVISSFCRRRRKRPTLHFYVSTLLFRLESQKRQRCCVAAADE